MKAITLWQPWATLIAIGAKNCETRSWATSYRGLLAIHAAKRFQKPERELCSQWPFKDALEEFGYTADNLPLGAVVAVVELVGCHLTLGIHPYSVENAFGDWSEGRYFWALRLVGPPFDPIPAKGSQEFWEWDAPASILENLK